MALFNRSNKRECDYEFECTSGIDFVLVIKQTIKGSTFNLIFSQLTNHANMFMDNEGWYEVPQKYYNLIYSNAKSTYSEIKEQLLKDKIQLNFGNITEVWLKKEGKDWIFKIKIEGNYHDTN